MYGAVWNTRLGIAQQLGAKRKPMSVRAYAGRTSQRAFVKGPEIVPRRKTLMHRQQTAQ